MKILETEDLLPMCNLKPGDKVAIIGGQLSNFVKKDEVFIVKSEPWSGYFEGDYMECVYLEELVGGVQTKNLKKVEDDESMKTLMIKVSTPEERRILIDIFTRKGCKTWTEKNLGHIPDVPLVDVPVGVFVCCEVPDCVVREVSGDEITKYGIKWPKGTDMGFVDSVMRLTEDNLDKIKEVIRNRRK